VVIITAAAAPSFRPRRCRRDGAILGEGRAQAGQRFQRRAWLDVFIAVEHDAAFFLDDFQRQDHP
jgi:hypothetical protein